MTKFYSVIVSAARPYLAIRLLKCYSNKYKFFEWDNNRMYSLVKQPYNGIKNYLIQPISYFLVIFLLFTQVVNCSNENTTLQDSAKITAPPTHSPPWQETELSNPQQQILPSPKTDTQASMLEAACIIVDISAQKLSLYQNCKLWENKLVENNFIISYPVSTSKYGIGNQARSNKTPLGLHRIEEKIGANAPAGMIFKARQSTGKIAEINQAGAGDLVTTRIMWLKGLEPNKNQGAGIDSYQRYVYIHGTVEENKIGQPASHGCIRMNNLDVIGLFDQVKEGTLVDIRARIAVVTK
jgi:lipoprotein-anchoring transpeptidase ErfK/SrfK